MVTQSMGIWSHANRLRDLLDRTRGTPCRRIVGENKQRSSPVRTSQASCSLEEEFPDGGSTGMPRIDRSAEEEYPIKSQDLHPSFAADIDLARSPPP